MKREKIVHTPECIARKKSGLGGCWCASIAKAKAEKERGA